MLAVSVVGVVLPARAAGTQAGTVQVTTPGTTGTRLDSGGSATHFTLKLPAGASCPGDSANDGYKVQTYIVSDAIDPATLQFGSAGPTQGSVGTQATFKQPMYTTQGSAIVNRQTQDKTTANPRGVILEQETMWFGNYGPGNIPPGTYNVGVACTLGGASDTQLKDFWNNKITFTTNASDSPAQVTWTVPTNDPPTTGTPPTTAPPTTAPPTTVPPTTVPPTTVPPTTVPPTTAPPTTAPPTTAPPTTAPPTTTTTTSTTTTTTTTTSTTAPPTATTGAPATTTTIATTQSVSTSSAAGGPGSNLTVQGDGFGPGTPVQVYMLSDPVLLGTVTVDGSGVARATVTIPANATPGQHTIELRGTAPGGAARVLSTPFTVTGTLPRTGQSMAPILVWGALFVLFGSIAVALGRPTPGLHGIKR